MKAVKYFIMLLLTCIICLLNPDAYATAFQIYQQVSPEINSFSLEGCISFAARNSFEVRLAKLDFLIAQTGQGAAEAIYDTVLSLDVSYEDDKREPVSSLAGDHSKTNIYSIGIDKTLPSGTELDLSFSDKREWTNSAFVSRNPAHTSEVALEIRQPLAKNAFGYIDRRNISVTSLAIENADLDTKEKIEALFADVEEAYWEWLYYKESLETYRKLLEKAKDLHQINAKNYEIGRIEKSDFLASEANVLIREKDFLVAENAYKRAEGLLKLLLNMEADYKIYPQETLIYRKVEFNLEDCLVEAFKKRRDYLQGRRNIEIKELVLESKANARWPEIDLVATLAANGVGSSVNAATRRITNQDNASYYTGVEISMPLESRLARSEFDAATNNKEKAILILKQIERTIVTEVGSAYRDYITFEASVDKLSQAAALQQQKLEEEEKRFRYGRSDTKRLIDYQQDYLNTQLEVARSIADLEISRATLEKTLNIIIEKYKGLL